MSDNTLVHLTEAVRLLAEARTLDEITHLHSMAQAAEQYAKAEKLGDEAEQYAREIRVRAARLAGELLKEMAAAGARATADGSAGGTSRWGRLVEPTLSDLQITKDQSSRWQAIARVPEDAFEEQVTQGRGETAIARGGHVPRKPLRAITPKTKTNGYTRNQSIRGLQAAAVQIQGLAEALDGHLMGDWSRLYDDAEAQQWFDAISESLPVVNAHLKRALRDRRGDASAAASAR